MRGVAPFRAIRFPWRGRRDNEESGEVILHDELRGLADRPETYPLLAVHMQGAMTTVRAPGGERHHFIEDAAGFPMVRIAVQGSVSEPVRLNIFSTRGVYEEAAWELEGEGEAAVAELIARRSADRAAQLRAARAEADRRTAARRRREAESAALTAEETKAGSLARLRAAFALRPGQRDWGRLSRDLYVARERIERRGDLEFVSRLIEERERSWEFPLSPRQRAWLDDILRRLIKTLGDEEAGDFARSPSLCRDGGIAAGGD